MQAATLSDPLRRRALLGLLMGAAAAPAILPSTARAADVDSVALTPETSDRNVIRGASPSALPLSVVGVPGQTENLTEWRSSAGQALVAITRGGRIQRRSDGDSDDHAPFGWEVSTAVANDRPYPVSYLGYNVGANGNRIVAEEPSASYVIEADYDDGAKRTMELYSEFSPLDSSITIRPFFWQVRRDATTRRGMLTRSTIMGDPLVVEDPDGTRRGVFDRHRMVLQSADEGYDMGLVVDARAKRGAYLSLGSDNARGVVTVSAVSRQPPVGQVGIGGSGVMHLFGAPRGVPGAAMSVGVVDAGAVGTFAVGTSTIDLVAVVARGRSSQRADLQQWQDAGGRALAAVTPAGRLRWSSGNQRLTVGSSGAAAALPSRPARYLEVVDSDGQVLLIPAYLRTAA